MVSCGRLPIYTGMLKSTLTTRGRRQEHHRHFAHQRILRGSSETSFLPVDPTLANESCPQVQHVVPEVTIPPEVTPENVTTYIVDSGGISWYCTSIFSAQPGSLVLAGP